MRLGFTYDLREDYLREGLTEEQAAEFDTPDTINAIDAVLTSLGFAVERIGNIKALAAALVSGKRWDAVFNIAEGLHGTAREAQIPALLEAYEIPYTFSDAATLALSLDKARAKRVIRDGGLPTPDFAVVESEADVARINLPYPLFAKPLAEGTGKGVAPASHIASPAALKARCHVLLKDYRQPVLVETYLPGREFTVGILGTGTQARAIGVLEIRLREDAEPLAYSFVNKHDCWKRIEYTLAEDAQAREAADVALAAWRALNCRDGGRVDLRSDASGRPQFMEANPLAGLNPELGDLVILTRLQGMGYETLIGEIMRSCLARYGLPWPTGRKQKAAR